MSKNELIDWLIWYLIDPDNLLFFEPKLIHFHNPCIQYGIGFPMMIETPSAKESVAPSDTAISIWAPEPSAERSIRKNEMN